MAEAAASASIKLLKGSLKALETEASLASEMVNAVLGIYSVFSPFVFLGINVLCGLVLASKTFGVQPSITAILVWAISVLKATDYALSLGLARQILTRVQSALASAESSMTSSSLKISQFEEKLNPIEEKLNAITSDARKVMDAIHVDLVKARTKVAITVRVVRHFQSSMRTCRCGGCCKGTQDDASESLLRPAVHETDADIAQPQVAPQVAQPQGAQAKPAEVPPQVAHPVLEQLSSDLNSVVSEIQKINTVFSVLSNVSSLLVTVATALAGWCVTIDAPEHYCASLTLAASVINQFEHSVITETQASFQQALAEIPLLQKALEDLQAQPKVLHDDMVALDASWEAIKSALSGISCFKGKAALSV